jgi:hypothetical protein
MKVENFFKSVDHEFAQKISFNYLVDLTSLSDVCTNLKINYDEMIKFIESMEESDLNKEIENLFNGNVDFTEINDLKKLSRYSKLCALSLFRKRRNIELGCCTYQNISDEYNDETNMYEKKSDEFAKECKMFIEEINSGNILKIDESVFNELDKTVNRITNLHNKKLQLIEYTLRYYTPDTPLKISRSSIEPDTKLIKHELDNITDVIRSYVEDMEWKINISRDLNFKVPISKVIFSNTLKPEEVDNEDFKDYLNLIVIYLRRLTGTKVKHYIKQDNKYDIYWILIVVSIQKEVTSIDTNAESKSESKSEPKSEPKSTE